MYVFRLHLFLGILAVAADITPSNLFTAANPGKTFPWCDCDTYDCSCSPYKLEFNATTVRSPDWLLKPEEMLCGGRTRRNTFISCRMIRMIRTFLNP